MRSLDRAMTLAVVLAAYALRVFRLGAQELRGDEAFGYFFIQQPYAQIVGDTLALEEPHPILSYFVHKSWLSIAGSSEYALRYLGVLFGVLAVALLFRLAVESKLPVRISIVSAALLAVSPYAIWHAQDARMYSMSIALTVASVLSALVWMRRQTLMPAVAYVVVTFAALHTHYFAAFIVVAQNLVVLALLATHRLQGRTAGQWLLGQVVLWLLYAPWLLAVRDIISGYGGNGDTPGFVEAIQRASAVFAAGESVPEGQGTLWAWLALSAVVLGIVALVASPRHRPIAWLFGLYLAVPVLAAWYGAQARPIFDERYLAAAAPPFFVLAAASLLPLVHEWDGDLNATSARLWGLAGATLLCVFFAGAGLSLMRYYDDPMYSKTRGWRPLAQRLEALSACVPPESVRLAQNYPDPTLWYYFGDEPAHLVLPPLANDAVLAGAEVDALVEKGVARVLFIAQPSDSWDADHIGESALREEFARAATDGSTNWPVEVFVRPSMRASDQPIAFQNGAILRASELASDIVPAGGVVVAKLAWDLSQVADAEPLTVFVQLLDEEGRLVGQVDRPLPADSPGDAAAVADSYGILVPRDLAGGDYRVIAGLYRPQTGERIELSSGTDHVELEPVRVWDGELSDCLEQERASTGHD